MIEIDPICNMKVNTDNAKFSSEHDGKKFYFCSSMCKQKFDKDPHKYGHH